MTKTRFVESAFMDEICALEDLKSRWAGKSANVKLEVIREDLEFQINTFRDMHGPNEEGITHVDQRFVGGVAFVELTDEEAQYIFNGWKDNGFKLTAGATFDGKYSIDGDLNAHYTKFKRAVDLVKMAKDIGATEDPMLRIFTFYNDKAHGSSKILPATEWRERVVSELQRRADYAGKHGVTLVLENEKYVYGSTPHRQKYLVDHVNRENVGLAYDPGNFVEQEGIQRKRIGMITAAEMLAPYVWQIHNKDWKRGGDIAVLTGTGDGHMEDVHRIVFHYHRFAGLLIPSTHEPHLSDAREKSGFTTPEQFEQASKTARPMFQRVYQAHR